MASVNRVTVPEEFYDITSTKLLKAAEPQYFHGQMFKRALALSLAQLSVDSLPLPGRELSQNGEDYADAEAQRLELESDFITSEAITFVTELGQGPGHTVRLNRPKFTDSRYEQSDRTIAADQTISTTPISVQSEQVSITLQHMAGPYSLEQSAVAPYGINQTDAKLALHKLSKLVGMHLVRDFDKALDYWGVKLFDTTASVVYSGAATQNSDFSAVNSHKFTYDLTRRANQALDEASIPKFPDGKRIMVITPKQAADLGSDTEFQKLVRADQRPSGMNPVWNASFYAELPEFHVFKSNTLTKVLNGSVPVHYAQAFGPGMVGAGMGSLPEVRQSTNDNYGNQLLLIWQWLVGFAVLDNRFGISLRSD